MTAVDSSVWISFYNGVRTPEADRLAVLLATGNVVVPDLVVCEVLRGFRVDRDYEVAKADFAGLPVLTTVGATRAVRAAERFRLLRKRGITVRKTVDLLIASCCLDDDLPLLHSDRDFNPFVQVFGLMTA